ncbi:protein of unknown function DUF488 [Pseudoalteromonas phage J2-1_QLiu-2017]|nr:protein of unknown function DUF488 [Pseudoalteromonas phage J2-1_QLiu-2017]
MIVTTAQMSKHRFLTENNVPWIDTTVKSGDKRLAPDWSFLMEYKNNRDWGVYKEKFYAKMRTSFLENKSFWEELINKDEITLLCYCKAGQNCHRLLLVDILKKLCNHYGIEFNYIGEIK